MNNFKFSQRSETSLKGVNPALTAVVRRALQLTTTDFIVIEGLRTIDRQKELVATGKSKTMDSKHLTGRAVDIIPVGADWNNWRCWLPILDAMYRAGKELGVPLRFGITWTGSPHDTPAKFLDAPHVELF